MHCIDEESFKEHYSMYVQNYLTISVGMNTMSI